MKAEHLLTDTANLPLRKKFDELNYNKKYPLRFNALITKELFYERF
jgi:hypothetical protein